MSAALDRRRRSRAALRLVAALLLVLSTAAQAAGIGLRTLDGVDTTLAEQVPAGRWTLAMIYTTYCGVCRSEYPVISAFHDAHKDKDARVIGIALDGYAEIDTVRRYVAKKPFSFPSVVGEPAIVGAAFAAATDEAFTGTPSYLLFNPARQLVAARSGTLSREALEDYLARQAP
jgi:thiol-disulfide isomerase/thioredoxin